MTLYCLIQGMMNPLIFNPGLAMFVLTIAVLAADGSEDRDAQAVRPLPLRDGWVRFSGLR